MPSHDPLRVMTCRKCKAAGVEKPFRGTFAQLGKHHQDEHPREAKADGAGIPPADVSRETSPGSPDPALGGPGPSDDGAGYVRDDEAVPGGGTVTAEGEAPRKKRWREKIWGGGDTEAPAGVSGPMSKLERTPTRGKRSSTDFLFALAWKFMGAQLERREVDVIVGRTMIYQSPVAGAVLENLTKGTVLDKLLQPFARRADELEAAAALFMLPMLFGMLERNPEMMPILEPLIRDAIRVHLVAMAPIIKKEKADAEALANVTRDLYPDAPDGTDPIDIVLGTIVAGTMFDPDAQPAPADPTAQQPAA